jgi:predicted nucleic acid-binding protein
MSIVSNASPLINLARIGKFNLLHKLYGELIVSKAMRQEVSVEGAGHPGADEVKTAPWIKVRAVTNRPLVLQEAEKWKR